MAITLTSEQEESIALMRAFLANDDPSDRTFTVHGLAGCGKTTVLSSMARSSPKEHIVTLTGKAASVLRSKGVRNAQTIHSLFYNLKNKKVEEDGTTTLYFAPKLSDGALSDHVIYLDECSMIDTYMAGDLLRTGAKIVAFGDPGQLPPVRGEQYFKEADFALKTVHRQALESAIIRQAHSIRRTCGYREDGEDFKVQAKVSLDDLAAADMVLCFMRRTADKLNASIRKHKGFNLPYPMAGEKMLCLKNAAKHGVFNGGIYTLLETFPNVEGDMLLEIEGARVRVPNVMFNAKTDKMPVDADATSQFSYASCLTTHKSQGSEWDKVVLIDECRQSIRREWLYTGVTRAASSIIIQR